MGTTPMFEYLKVTSSLCYFSYRHPLRYQVSFALYHQGHRRYSRRKSTHSVVDWVWFQCKDSEECSSQSELLLYSPQGLSALLHLLLLVWLQRHVNHICQAAVAQDTWDTQENFILHSMHALEMTTIRHHSQRRTFQSIQKKKSMQGFLPPHLHQCGHRVHFVEVLHDALHQVSHRHADGPGGVALQLDDLIGSAAHTQRITSYYNLSSVSLPQQFPLISLIHLLCDVFML